MKPVGRRTFVTVPDHQRSVRKHRFVRLAMAFLAVSLACLFWLCPDPPSLPADREVRHRFRTQLATFEKLRDMMMSEPTLRGAGPGYLCGGKGTPRAYLLTGNEWWTGSPDDTRRERNQAETLASVGLSADRYSEYLKLLQAVHGQSVQGDEISSQHNVIVVTLSSLGLAVSGQSKSVEYSPEGIPGHCSVVEDTDVPTELKGNWYSPLGNGWYIHRYRW
jgi:hypothetical protein